MYGWFSGQGKSTIVKRILFFHQLNFVIFCTKCVLLESVEGPALVLESKSVVSLLDEKSRKDRSVSKGETMSKENGRDLKEES